MPKLKNQFPKKCRDREQCYSCYKGKRYFHGKWGSPEADQSYKRFIAALLENPTLLLRDSKTGDLLVSELSAAYIQHAESRNMGKTDVEHFKTTVGYLVEVFGGFSVNEFSPKKLRIVRDLMVKAGTLSRPMINKYISKIRSIFSWGIGEEIVNPSIEHALRTLKALKKGEQGTYDRPPREAVPDAVVARTLPFLSPTVSAMVQIQRLLGARPSEIFNMRVGNIDRTRSTEFWYYTPEKHKTEQYIGKKPLPLSKDEQELIAPYLEGKKPEQPVFSPRQAVHERRERQRAERKSKRTPSQQERDRRNAENPADRMGEFYDKSSYWRAIQHGIRKGNQHLPDGEKIPRWSPYQLRHAAATEISRTAGKDKVKALLAHRSMRTTEIYDHFQRSSP